MRPRPVDDQAETRTGDVALTDPIDAIWPKIRAAFAQYGVTTRVRLGATRRNMLQRHLDDGIEPEELPMAVHGYLRQCGGPDAEFSSGQKAGFYLRFETVYKIENMELRVELGAQGPWAKPRSREAEVKARQAAARELVEAARREKDKPRLRAV